MEKNKILILTGLLINIVMFSQNTNNVNLILTSTEEQNLSFYEYEPRLVLKAILTLK
ncbi:hypothetical protein NACSLCCMFF_60111 [Tenacibaculum maritimum]|nr:hypothetical protein NACSLCCMFF_60111 [Tenacibaculum maritimum]